MNVIGLEDISSFLYLAKINDDLKSKSFHVIKLSSLSYTQLQNLPTFSLDFFQITLSIGYAVNCKVDDTSYNNARNFISFGRPNQVISLDFKKLNEHSNGYIILFEQHFLKILNDTFKKKQIQQWFEVSSESVIHLTNSETNKIRLLFDAINEEYHKCTRGCDIIIQSYLLILLQETARLSLPISKDKALSQNREQQILSDFKILLEQYGQENKSSSFYSDKLSISVGYLNEVIKKLTGKTLSQTIKEKSLLKAKTYLLQTNLTISQIAFHVGFEDASNFTRFFKRKTGVTPSKFRLIN